MKIRRFIQPLLLVALVLGLSAASFGGVFVSVNVGPPPLPVYAQPACPGVGFIWTPGYWGWGDDGYYWVPGTWVQPPEVGLLWTPGYWGWNNGAYLWNAGYWGPHVGFYGGINYGFGYTGIGYEGGYWRGRDFFYNRSVNNVNVTNIRNVYNKTVIVNNRTRVSYNGGRGGVNVRETAQQRRWGSERHVEATSMQRDHVQEASRNRELLARNNHGRPAIAATERPNDFSHHVAARSAGGNVDRAALNATPKNMPARNENNARSAKRNENPRPSTASRTETGARNNEKTRETSPTTARTEHNVPKPPNASDRNTRNENARNVPKPSNATPSERTHENANARVATPHANAKANENANARVATPHGNANAHENANARVNTPRENNHPATAATRPQPSERSSRAMGMPQGEHAPRSAAPAPRPESHAAARPAEHSNPQPHAQAKPQHEASKPAKSEPPKDEKKH